MTDHPDSSTDANRVEKSVSKTVLPEVSGGSLTDFGVSPTNQTVSPSNSDGSVSPADQSVSVTDCDVLPTDQTVSLTGCGESLTDQNVSPTYCSAPPTGKTVSITDCRLAPTYQTMSPTHCGVSPTDQTVSPTDFCVPPSVQVVSLSGGNVSDSLVSASSTDRENGSNFTAEFNANGSFMSNLNIRPNFLGNAFNVQTVERHTLTPENKPYVTYHAREQTIPTSFPNRWKILESGFFLKGDFFQCYSCGVNENSLQFCGDHIDSCLHHQVKSKSLNQKEDVFVNQNAADTEACFKCKIKIKKVLFLECHHLMSCTDCLLEDLHRGPSEPRRPGSAETSGHNGNIGFHKESIACPMCGTLSSEYVLIQWD